MSGTSTGYHAQAYMEAQRGGTDRSVIKSAVAFPHGKEAFVSMEDGRLVPYRLQANEVERGNLARPHVRESEPIEQNVFSLEYSAWLERMLEISDD